MKLDVPYYSQYIDVKDPYWQPRACGFCCIKMIATFHNKDIRDIVEIANLAKSEGGYSEHGIIHDWSVGYFQKLGLNSNRMEKMNGEKTNEGISKIVNSLKNNCPVIISVARDREGKKAFHQVVLTGFEEEEGDVSGFYMNDSDTKIKGEGINIFMSMIDFLKEWRGMAIFVKPQ